MRGGGVVVSSGDSSREHYRVVEGGVMVQTGWVVWTRGLGWRVQAWLDPRERCAVSISRVGVSVETYQHVLTLLIQSHKIMH